MKGGFVAAAVAAMAGFASANVHHRHAHAVLAANKRGADVCVPHVTTIVTVITGQPTLLPPKTTSVHHNTTTVKTTSSVVITPTSKSTSKSTSTSTSTPVPITTSVVVPVVPLPTPEAQTCPTPGVYTFPATTITVSQTTTVCGATSTQVPAGPVTYGGVVTVVETATTVTCPIATVSTSGTVTTSTIVQTEYVCPSAGTYTIVPPTTTTVTEETVIVYPVPTTICPGTYTKPEQVVTVTKTGYVTYCPFTSVGLPTTTPAPAPPAPAPEAPSTSVAPPPPATTSVAPAPVKAAGFSSTSSSKISITLGDNGDHYGLTYTPYDSSNGNCKSADAVDADIADIKSAGFTIIRVYSTDCNTLETVGAACEKYGLEMIIGIFVKDTGCSYQSPDIKSQVDAIAAWGKFDLVRLMIVGNEAIMNNYCSPSDLAGLISDVKSVCSGYTGHYTVAETLNIWQRSDVSGALCGSIDVTAANIHAYFNPTITPDNAGDFVAGQLSLLEQICPGNQVISAETGWPTGGECNGVACPGVSEQATALSSIREKCGGKVVFFSYENDMWKNPGAFACEQSWGTKNYFAGLSS